MSLIPCPECRKEISSAATSCPSCGHPMTAKPAEPEFQAFRRRTLTGGLLLCLIGLPIGVVLGLPVVWGLAIAGIIIGGIKLLLLKPAP